MPSEYFCRLRASAEQEALSSATAALSLSLAASHDGQCTSWCTTDTEDAIGWHRGGLHRVRELCQDGALCTPRAQFLDYARGVDAPAG